MLPLKIFPGTRLKELWPLADSQYRVGQPKLHRILCLTNLQRVDDLVSISSVIFTSHLYVFTIMVIISANELTS